MNIPLVWKTALICPCFKGPCIFSSDYRPVALTYVSAKVKEYNFPFFKLMVSSCTFVCFLMRCSIRSQLLATLNVDHGTKVGAGYIDFSKAFNSAYCVKLLFKIEAYGFK